MIIWNFTIPKFKRSQPLQQKARATELELRLMNSGQLSLKKRQTELRGNKVPRRMSKGIKISFWF